jgi:hypothetical protein
MSVHQYIAACIADVSDSNIRGRAGTLKYEMIKWMMTSLDCHDEKIWEAVDDIMQDQIFFGFTTRLNPNGKLHKTTCFLTLKDRGGVGDHFIPVRNIADDTSVHGSNSHWNTLPVSAEHNKLYTTLVLKKHIYDSYRLPEFWEVLGTVRLGPDARPSSFKMLNNPGAIADLADEFITIDLEKQKITHVRLPDRGWVHLPELFEEWLPLKGRQGRERYESIRDSITSLYVLPRWGGTTRAGFAAFFDGEAPGPRLKPKSKKSKRLPRLISAFETLRKEAIDADVGLDTLAGIDVILFELTQKDMHTFKQCMEFVDNLSDSIYVKTRVWEMIAPGLAIFQPSLEELDEMYDLRGMALLATFESNWKEFMMATEYEKEKQDFRFPLGFPPRESFRVSDEDYKSERRRYVHIERVYGIMREPVRVRSKDLFKSCIFEAYNIPKEDRKNYRLIKKDIKGKYKYPRTWEIGPIDVILLTSFWEYYVHKRGGTLYRRLARKEVLEFEEIADRSLEALITDMKESESFQRLSKSVEDNM